MFRAYTRQPAENLSDCVLTHLQRMTVDQARAAGQHAAYEQALVAAGCDLRRLPGLPDAPDGMFV